MTHNRRTFLRQGAGATVLASGLVLPQGAFADGEGIPYANETLPGSVLVVGNDIESAIGELQNTRSIIGLANTAYLQDECQRVAAGAAEGITAATRLRTEFQGKLSDSQITAALSTIGVIVGGIGIFCASASTSPIWIGLAVGVGTANAAWSLIQFNNASGTDKAVVGVSHFSGRFSLIGAHEGVSAAAKSVGSALSGLAAAADLYSAIKATGSWAAASDRLDQIETDLGAIRQRYISLTGDPGACREARLAELDSSIEALQFVRDLGTIKSGTGDVILP